MEQIKNFLNYLSRESIIRKIGFAYGIIMDLKIYKLIKNPIATLIMLPHGGALSSFITEYLRVSFVPQ
jgi:hypothetical protein